MDPPATAHQLATLATSVLATGLHHYQVVANNSSESSSSGSSEIGIWNSSIAAISSSLSSPLTSSSSSSPQLLPDAAVTAATLSASTLATVLLPHLTNFSTSTATSTIATTNHLASTITSTFLAAVSAANAADNDAPTTTTITSAPLSGDPSSLSTLSKIVICVILTAVILGTIIGNILVCIAVCLVKKLRRPCNYLLVSLALSDLCVAVLVMPVALLNELRDEWPFGTLFCDIWVAFDVLSCTASILNLCAISVDRYWAITKPLEYGVKRTPRRMLMCVGLVWLGAACISLPPLLILGNEHESETGAPFCVVCQNFGYQIYATFCAFYLPLIIMLFVYYQIFRAARRIVLDEKRAQTRLDQAMMINGRPQPQLAGFPSKDLKVPGQNNGSGTGSTALIEHGAPASPHQQQRRLRFQLAKERKASTTLGIIMSSFTLCWLPFFILAIVRPFLDADHMVPNFLLSTFLWLGYANSLLNPIIYATLNRDFRKPFQEILFFRCSNLNTIMREEYYHSQYGEPASQRVVVGGGGGGGGADGHGARESFL